MFYKPNLLRLKPTAALFLRTPLGVALSPQWRHAAGTDTRADCPDHLTRVLAAKSFWRMSISLINPTRETG